MKFVLHHTGIIGRVLEGLLAKIGTTALKFVAWLADKIGWKDVMVTKDAIKDCVNRELCNLHQKVESVKSNADAAINCNQSPLELIP